LLYDRSLAALAAAAVVPQVASFVVLRGREGTTREGQPVPLVALLHWHCFTTHRCAFRAASGAGRRPARASGSNAPGSPPSDDRIPPH